MTMLHWPVRHVVFDWNGTLIDDLDLAVRALNELCSKHGVDPVTRERYRQHFRFPIASFYLALGFDFDCTPFSDLVQDYLRVFDAGVRHCPLHAGSVAFLDHLQARGIGASVLSASHRGVLERTIADKGLSHRFTYVLGLDDELAAGKQGQARRLQSALALAPEQVLYVGDTTHDAEIADALGWSPCILSCGHQSEAQLAGSRISHLPGFDELHRRFAGAQPSDLEFLS